MILMRVCRPIAFVTARTQDKCGSVPFRNASRGDGPTVSDPVRSVRRFRPSGCFEKTPTRCIDRLEVIVGPGAPSAIRVNLPASLETGRAAGKRTGREGVFRLGRGTSGMGSRGAPEGGIANDFRSPRRGAFGDLFRGFPRSSERGRRHAFGQDPSDDVKY